MLPVANKPILVHALESMARAGIEEAAITVPPAGRPAVTEAVGSGEAWGLEVRYLPTRPTDELPAILAASEDFLDGHPFVLQHGDGILRHDLPGLLRAVEDEDQGPDALLLVHRDGGTAQIGGDRAYGASLLALAGGFALKPGLAVAGAQVFGAGFMRCAGDHIRRHHADADLGALASGLARCGARVGVQRVDGWSRFAGRACELLELNRLVLDDLAPDFGTEADLRDTRVEGRVDIHPTARITSSLVRGPAVIGAEATVTDAFIGPYTAVGPGARIEGAEIEHSIVFPEAEVLHVGARLESSVVGRAARVARDFSLPRALRLHLGDGASVVLR